MPDDPALPAQPQVRREGARVQRPPLVLPRETDPEIRVLGAKREAREEARAHEVAPAPEHGRDLHARPGAKDLVERAGRPRAALLEAAPGASPRPEAAPSPCKRYGQNSLYATPGRS